MLPLLYYNSTCEKIIEKLFFRGKDDPTNRILKNTLIFSVLLEMLGREIRLLPSL